ncbi:MAG: phage minor capsid protein [[Eubacterium] siraeum]
MLSFRDIARIFEEIELRLIASLKRNLSRHKAEEEKEGFEWSAWQAEKLNNIDNFRKDNVQIADEYVDVIDDGTRQLMTDQFHEGSIQRSSRSLMFRKAASMFPMFRHSLSRPKRRQLYPMIISSVLTSRRWIS